MMMKIKSFQSEIFDIFSDPNQFPLVLFNIDEYGPGVGFRDFQLLPYADLIDENLETYLVNLAISYISAMGHGHNYLEGVYDLPAGKLKNYRLLLVSFYLGSPLNDTYNFNNYYQIGIFVPTPLAQIMPSLATIESVILTNIKRRLEGSFFLTVDKLQQIKKEILTILTFVIFENMKKCDC
ncbi:MAG: hypothetical protein ACXAB7_16455 [Candidatus Kariarchaeaceae archaeon]|jgi:hypothetical protein